VYTRVSDNRILRIAQNANQEPGETGLLAYISATRNFTEGSKINIPCCVLLARQLRATVAWCACTQHTRATWRTSYANFACINCVTYAPDSRRMRASHKSVNLTQMLRARWFFIPITWLYYDCIESAVEHSINIFFIPMRSSNTMKKFSLVAFRIRGCI
jgi:hypothetical protein